MRSWVFLCAVSLSGCAPDLGDPASRVDAPRVLAIRADPPEVKPGEEVSYRALVAGPEGTVESPALVWSFCASPKPITEDNAVSAACLGDEVIPVGGPSAGVEAAIPIDACAIFGPDPPPGGLRPRDPDVTGGFYQPVRARAAGLTAFARSRIVCNLPSAPVDVAADLAKRYRVNENPRIGTLRATAGGAEIDLDHVPVGARVRLSAGWRAEDAESFLMFDPDAARIVERREALWISWFATAGDLADEQTGRAEDDPALTTETTWDAPQVAGAVHLWLVLRDSRGGVDFAGYDLTVAP